MIPSRQFPSYPWTILLRTLLPVLLALVAPTLLPAQAGRGGGVRGLVVSTADEPVAMAIVQLRARGDSAILRSVQTVEAGRFQFDGVAAGSYYLVIRRIGFRLSQTQEFTVAPEQLRDLGLIRIEPASIELEAVVVTVERPDVTFEPDRTGFLVEALAATPDAVVTDALRGIPDIMVDPDGAIRLRGSTPAIYINGRPAPMNGVSLTVFLEQFPASQIERIEVLDAPPARFGAQGAGGVINIVLKQGVNLGVNGSAALSVGTRGQRTASGRVTMQRGPWTVNSGLNTRWSDSENSDFTLRQNLLATPLTFLRQESQSESSSRSGGGSLDVRYDLTRRSRLHARANLDGNGSDRTGLTGTSHLDANQDPTLWYDRLTRNESDGSNRHLMAGWSYDWVPERHGLEFEVTLTGQGSGSALREETVAEPVFQGDPRLPAWLTRRESDDRNTGLAVGGNYNRPLGRQGRMDVGAEVRRNDSEDEEVTSRYLLAGAGTPDQTDARPVSQVERITSAYLTLNRRFGQFGVNFGLRGEMVSRDVTLPGGVLLDRDEENLFPSLNVNWNPRQRMSMRVGYGRRINRPGVSVLDPTNRSTDPLNRSVGNPDLESSFTHNLSANFNWTGRYGQFSMGPYWNRTTNGWERVTTVDAAGISTSTWANLNSRTNVGTSFNWGLPRLAGWRANLNLSLSRSTLAGSIRTDGAQDGQLRWAVNGNVDGTILGTMTAQGSFGYQPPRDLVQGQTSGQWRADFSFRYRVMNNRTSIGLSFQDPFELRKTTQEIRDPSVIQTGSSRVTTRSMTINLSYAFGRPGGGGPGAMRRP